MTRSGLTHRKEKISILEDLDFELELIHRDAINVSYIIALLRNMQSVKPEEQDKQRKSNLAILDTEIQLRSKKELIERFIEEHFPAIPKDGDVGVVFDKYWTKEKHKAIQVLSKAEGLDIDGLQKVDWGLPVHRKDAFAGYDHRHCTRTPKT